MKITVTSNQQRHLNLINVWGSFAAEVFCLQECTEVLSEETQNSYPESEIMRDYFSNLIESETNIFGEVTFSSPNVKSISVKMEDLSRLDKTQLKMTLSSDLYIVFGSSFIRGWLAEFPVSRGALNIHMGLSPYYRGSSRNFWALYDRNPSYVGATVHKLDKDLDSGPILFQYCTLVDNTDSPFAYSIKVLATGHKGLYFRLETGSLLDLQPGPQDKNLELRYSRKKDLYRHSCFPGYE